jgi:hypothetical protein
MKIVNKAWLFSHLRLILKLILKKQRDEMLADQAAKCKRFEDSLSGQAGVSKSACKKKAGVSKSARKKKAG